MSFIVPGVITMLSRGLDLELSSAAPKTSGCLGQLFALELGSRGCGRRIRHAKKIARKCATARRRARETGRLCRRFENSGVMTFSLCLFFTKLVAYTFLYWLPFYIERTEIAGTYLSAAKAGELSVIFDLGGIGRRDFLAGYISDKYNAAIDDRRRFRLLVHPGPLHVPRVRFVLHVHEPRPHGAQRHVGERTDDAHHDRRQRRFGHARKLKKATPAPSPR